MFAGVVADVTQPMYESEFPPSSDLGSDFVTVNEPKNGETAVGIADRYGNTIKFEHTPQRVANRIPNGSFTYDNDLWTISNARYVYQTNDCGRYDDTSMRFNSAYDMSLTSMPVEIAPEKEYEISFVILNENSTIELQRNYEPNVSNAVWFADLYYYDNSDRLIKHTDRQSNSTIHTYDTLDRLLNMTLPNGTEYVYEYYDADLITDVSLADGSNRITTKYDDYGNVVSRTVYPDSSTAYPEYFTYDIAENVLSYTDPNANKTEYEYDNAGRLTKTMITHGKVIVKYHFQ